ncbi:unnamed protein product [Durusdinium trenchii]|uniref:Uncharacterized protein n=1 Tax=Durusdinium trenchii TaxID=1381693 RepID=A0ABP0JKR8_9DINO
MRPNIRPAMPEPKAKARMDLSGGSMGVAGHHPVAQNGQMQRRSLHLQANGGAIHTAPVTRSGSPREMQGWEGPSFAKATSMAAIVSPPAPCVGRSVSAEGGPRPSFQRGSPQPNHRLGVVEEDAQAHLATERANTTDLPAQAQQAWSSRTPSAHTRPLRQSGGPQPQQPQPQHPPPPPPPPPQQPQQAAKKDAKPRLSGSAGKNPQTDEGIWAASVVETLRRQLIMDGLTTRSSTNPSLPISDSNQDVRILRQEIKMEVEARKQMGLQIEALVQAEGKRREEAVRQQQHQAEQAESRLEQRWHSTVKEESALRRAVESHIEARLVAMQREVRLEVGSAASQTQQVLSEFGHFRDSIRQELEMQKLEISSASADLSRLVEQLRVQSRGETAVVNAESITDTLVRAEVRRQLSERSMEGQGNASTFAMNAISSRVDLLEKNLETECFCRQEEGSKLLATVQEILPTIHERIDAARQRQEDSLQELEKRLQEQLTAASSQVRALQQELGVEREQRQSSLQHEVKEREEVLLMVLKTLEEKIQAEHRVIEEKMAGMQISAPNASAEALERQLQASIESSVANFVERSSKELMTTRQDLLELREELQEVSRSSKESLDMAITRLSRAPLTATTGDRPGVEDVQRLIDGQTKLREELWNDVDRVRNELRMETAARKEEVQGVRFSVDRIREQFLGHPVPSGDTAAGLLPTDDVRAALVAERMAREQGDERCMEEMRDMIREERQRREKEYSALDLRMQSEEQTHFVESGKREERDRDIVSQISAVSEDLETVKLQMTNASQQRQQLEELQKAQDAMKHRLSQLPDPHAHGAHGHAAQGQSLGPVPQIRKSPQGAWLHCQMLSQEGLCSHVCLVDVWT